MRSVTANTRLASLWSVTLNYNIVRLSFCRCSWVLEAVQGDDGEPRTSASPACRGDFPRGIKRSVPGEHGVWSRCRLPRGPGPEHCRLVEVPPWVELLSPSGPPPARPAAPRSTRGGSGGWSTRAATSGATPACSRAKCARCANRTVSVRVCVRVCLCVCSRVRCAPCASVRVCLCAFNMKWGRYD